MAELSPPAHPPRIEVIIPVRSMAEHLDDCLAALMPQLAAGDTVTVVDDGSTDDTAAVAAGHGARVLSLPLSRGPYAARNHAASRSQADGLLFTDARCRPLSGWLERHRRLLAGPGVALSCTDIEVVRGRSLASRVAVLQQPFQIRTRVGVPGRWDWYPTANLGVLRTAFEAVGGFREIRSGGDEDLCRRVQQAGLGRMAADFDVFMRWQPREEFRQLLRQWYRYGRGAAMLAATGSPQPPTTGSPQPPTAGSHPTTGAAAVSRGAGQTAGRLLRNGLRSPADLPAVAGTFVVQLAFLYGKYRDRLRPRSAGTPTSAAPEAAGTPRTPAPDPAGTGGG